MNIAAKYGADFAGKLGVLTLAFALHLLVLFLVTRGLFHPVTGLKDFRVDVASVFIPADNEYPPDYWFRWHRSYGRFISTVELTVSTISYAAADKSEGASIVQISDQALYHMSNISCATIPFSGGRAPMPRQSSGRVSVQFLIDIDGNVINDTVVHSSGDKNVDFSIAKELRFCTIVAPATSDRQPAPRSFRIDYAWRLGSKEVPIEPYINLAPGSYIM